MLEEIGSAVICNGLTYIATVISEDQDKNVYVIININECTQFPVD